MSTFEQINENLSAQVCELEALLSVYPKELIISDHGVLADINEYIKNFTQKLPRKLEYSVELSLNGGSIELLISLPSSYPKEKPEIYARSSFLNRTQQLLLNQALNNILVHQEQNEPCIYTLIIWLQDNGEDYLVASNRIQDRKLNNRNKNKDQGKPTNFSRYWIYSHHIYSKIKRKKIIDLAEENSITGFCLIGKPGIICMEGAFEDCDYCWLKIKSMNWQKILLRLIENEDCENIDVMHKFKDFQEISFSTLSCHNDMGQVLKYLEEHTSQHAFKELFGIKGKLVELPD
ncbi:PREDICTED: RWD domain-containing protein 2A [Eufriesea mexicana]|uniref:RWD domain-containing protein 2A n=1 Tax=Eufriesea mexicana TaxID=516756 RepID=UPI00083C479D|nr:PREDICTED: RWD domain-containing protein 2A [Eufriesea mexicana]